MINSKNADNPFHSSLTQFYNLKLWPQVFRPPGFHNIVQRSQVTSWAGGSLDCLVFILAIKDFYNNGLWEKDVLLMQS